MTSIERQSSVHYPVLVLKQKKLDHILLPVVFSKPPRRTFWTLAVGRQNFRVTGCNKRFFGANMKLTVAVSLARLDPVTSLKVCGRGRRPASALLLCACITCGRTIRECETSLRHGLLQHCGTPLRVVAEMDGEDDRCISPALNEPKQTVHHKTFPTPPC